MGSPWAARPAHLYRLDTRRLGTALGDAWCSSAHTGPHVRVVATMYPWERTTFWRDYQAPDTKFMVQLLLKLAFASARVSTKLL